MYDPRTLQQPDDFRQTEQTDFLFLILQTNLKNGTVTENEISVCLENPMYSNTTYYFTALL